VKKTMKNYSEFAYTLADKNQGFSYESGIRRGPLTSGFLASTLQGLAFLE
jgi:hypothetical protein